MFKLTAIAFVLLVGSNIFAAIQQGHSNTTTTSAPAASASNSTQPVVTKPSSDSGDGAAAGATNIPPPNSVDNSRNAPKTAAGDDYRVGAGDVLQINVWKEPDASVANAIVRPDGKITMPLLKDVEVVGLTPAEIQKKITEKLVSFIPAVDVTVIVAGMNSKRVYVLGAVKKEGPIAYAYRMTAMQALAEAGGLTDYAKRKKIYVLRASNGAEHKIHFDYDGVLNGRDNNDLVLMPSDTIVVPH